MRWFLCAAPLAALALLAGACGIDDDGQPRPIPWDGAPGLEQVWQAESGRGHVGDAQVAGNVVVAYEASAHNAHWVFLDGTSGRVIGLPAGLNRTGQVLGVHATTDARGRPLVALYQDRGRSFDQRVYTPSGRLVWAGRSEARFAGGYVAGPRKTGSGHRDVIRTPSGRVVARLPMADFTGYETDVLDDVPGTDYGLDLQLVRPGLLVASGIGAGRSGIALVDVSRPGHAKVSTLRTPDDPDHIDGVRIAVAGGHVYATWPGPGAANARYIARYDASGTRPVWQRPTPAVATGRAGIRAFTDPETGGTTVTFTVEAWSRFADDDRGHRYWLIRPDTGAPYGPRAGRGGDPIGAYGGRVYSQRDDITREIVTDAVDQRTGTVRRIHGVVAGVTTKGYVIGGTAGGPDSSVNAYAWD